jgi:hypothetical protein
VKGEGSDINSAMQHFQSFRMIEVFFFFFFFFSFKISTRHSYATRTLAFSTDAQPLVNYTMPTNASATHLRNRSNIAAAAQPRAHHQLRA